ncbi:hypothetical protein N9E93_03820, partial [Oceanospirillaceae bacterium]|nr:hypothetical protein [Oceanospirillaceae bacterium]
IPLKICLVIVALFGGVAGASDLPNCPSSKNAYRHNCFGTITWPSGDKYVGEFNQSLPSGQGTYTWPSGEKYVGEFKDNKRNGQGTYTWPIGNKYVGEYKDNKRNGQGVLTYADGTVREGMWKDDEFLGTVAEWERAEKKRIAKEKQEELVRQEKKDKYDRIYNACLLDKGSDVDMQVSSLERAVKDTCKSIAKKPSWLENLRYD